MAYNGKGRQPDYQQVAAVDWAYLAGIIDGEGCVSIVMQRQVKCRRTLRHILKLFVGNTDPRLISWCREIFGGSVHYRPPKTTQHKPTWVWEVHHEQCGQVLKYCLPY